MKVPSSNVSKLLTPDQVGDILGVTPHTLAVWRSEGRYELPYIKTGRLVRYLMEDVQTFIQARRRTAPDE
ncbi:helix-turn-helix domain-containing protein [Chromatocurvus halotolerans]|uniref:Helix-turn-helix protein n=1 Tax=Chromatocurvus halotolerans TaxID=1132028 RepID=A0A4V2S9Z1_9GAMM|nr:helix-turn-helix domain-containing protein [Chromatocurvus halotolerans]TCO69710.1 helix-turn-helix protein [Chromatocurvus halotolerans]